MDRHTGCDFETAKMVIRELAHLHAVPIALKLKNPELFEEKIKKNTAPFYPPPPEVDKSEPNATLEAILREDKDCSNLIPTVRESAKHANRRDIELREPFVSISHHDLWVNNFMVKKTEEGKLDSIKFVDFQCCSYDSPLRDLLFFLFTSVQQDVLEKELDTFLEDYYEDFINCLKSFDCPTEAFAEHKFMEELLISALLELHRILFMYTFIVTSKSAEKAASETDQGGSVVPPLPTQDEVPLKVKERVWWTLKKFDRRTWIY